jgi:glycosyltransferase involved in cell wall biosynthesis
VRIALDTQSTLGQKTGIGVYTIHLLHALRQIAPQHEFIELDWRRDIAMRLDRRLRWQQCEVPRRSAAAGAHLLHVPGFDAPCRKRIPLVLTVHDLIGRLFPKSFPAMARFYWSRWLPFSIRFATHVIAVSHQTARDLHYMLRIPPERITVIPPAAGPQYTSALREEEISSVRRKYRLPARYILCVATLEPRKGIDTLLDAFACIRSRHGDVQLIVAGKRGWHCDGLFAQAKRLGMEPQAVFADYVADADLPALYAGAEMLAFPSRYEGFGLTVLEAMACATPVVCSNVASLPEVCGDAAVLVPPDRPGEWAAAMSQVLDDGSLRRSLAARGLEQATRFSWRSAAQKTLAVYERVLGAAAQPERQ